MKNKEYAQANSLGINTEQLELYHKIIQIAVDPESPFYGKTSLNKILRLPVEKREAIYSTLSEEYKQMLSNFVRKENEKIIHRDSPLFC